MWVHTCISFKRREDHISVLEHESRISKQREVLVKYETRILSAPKCEARVSQQHEARISDSKRDGHILTK